MKTKALSNMDRPHVMQQAAEVALLLDSDPVLAAQIKEHMPVSRLLDLLDLSGDQLWAAMQKPEAVESGD